MLLHHSTWSEVEGYLDGADGIIIPIGSTEQHGPNGLIGTDAICAEGIGGAMVPLDATLTVLDWMAELQAPALVVCGSYLGTLSHTLTTVAALRGRDIDIAGVVISESEESPVPVSETVETLQRHLGGVPVATVPRNAKPGEVMESPSEITGM